jgi:3-hydroxyisobutyrate dehydrogenase
MSRVAVIGTGLAGAPIAARLSAHGHDVVAWNRTRSKAEALGQEGVEVAATPAEAAEAADAVLLCLLGEDATEAVVQRAAPSLAPRALVVDLSTTGVASTTRFAAAIPRAAKAPFFGSVPEAERGALFFVVGCRDEDWNDVQALLAPLGEVFYVGDPATAAALKLSLNVLVYTMVENIAESIALARGQGVDPELVLATLARGTGVKAPIYLGRGRLIIDGDFAPRATVELARNDLALIAAAAAEAGLRLPLLDAAREVFERAGAADLDGEDMAAVAKLL